MEVFIFLVILVVIGGVLSANSANKQAEGIKHTLSDKGIDLSKFIKTEKYVGGHPDIDKENPNTFIYKNDFYLIIHEHADITKMPRTLGEIQISGIKNILVEDASSFENRVTLGRVLLTGIFALAWKKKKKNELAFVTIEWNDGKFEHNTIFNFEGKDAMQKANTARNSLIKAVR